MTSNRAGYQKLATYASICIPIALAALGGAYKLGQDTSPAPTNFTLQGKSIEALRDRVDEISDSRREIIVQLNRVSARVDQMSERLDRLQRTIGDLRDELKQTGLLDSKDYARLGPSQTYLEAPGPGFGSYPQSYFRLAFVPVARLHGEPFRRNLVPDI